MLEQHLYRFRTYHLCQLHPKYKFIKIIMHNYITTLNVSNYFLNYNKLIQISAFDIGLLYSSKT